MVAPKGVGRPARKRQREGDQPSPVVRPMAPESWARWQAPETETPGSGKVMVLVHGAGNIDSKYFEPFVAEIEKRIGGPFNFTPAYYGDVTNSPGRFSALATRQDSRQVMEFQRAFQKELEFAYASIPPAQRAPSITSFTLASSINVIATVTKEVSLYLFDTFITSKAKVRVTTALDQAMEQYEQIVLFSHSLGTVVAFDVLRECADRYNRIAYWFTTGCPLGKLRRIGMRGDDLGAIKASTIGRWYNIYDTSDIVADAIGPCFPRPGLRIHDIFVDVAADPIGSHDYMSNSETLDMLAAVMRNNSL